MCGFTACASENSSSASCVKSSPVKRNSSSLTKAHLHGDCSIYKTDATERFVAFVNQKLALWITENGEGLVTFSRNHTLKVELEKNTITCSYELLGWNLPNHSADQTWNNEAGRLKH
mgnify:CR=1 FL=1